MALLYSANFDCIVYKIRLFDNDIRVRPSMIVLIDCYIHCAMPTVIDYDNIIYYVRALDNVIDAFVATKDDAPSFFSINEKKEGVIQNTYISTNLKVISLLSEKMHKPLSTFDSVKAITSPNMHSSGTDTYVALSFEDVNNYSAMEFTRSGVSCVICAYTKNVTTAIDFVTFALGVDTADIKYVGCLDSIALTSNVISGDYCSLYYGILYLPADNEYFFELTASSTGHLYIDASVIISQTSIDSVTPVIESIILLKGYHTFLIKHYASASSLNDIVRLRLKPDNGVYTNVSVSELDAIGIKLYTFPIDAHSVIEDQTFSDMPSVLKYPSVDSMYIKEYRPIIVIAQKDSALLQKEFNRISYIKTPDIILSSLCTQGTIDTLLSDYSFPLAGNGVTLNCDRNVVLSPYITYKYDSPVEISFFELLDTDVYNDTTSNGKQCFSYTFAIVNHLNEYIRTTDILNLIDIDACRNVQLLQIVNNSDTYVRVVKLHMRYLTRIVFKNKLWIKEITLRDPVVSGLEWSSIISFRVFLKALEVVKLIDTNGETKVLQDLSDSTLVPVGYDTLGYIPTVFDHINIYDDIRYGSEFIMFCLATMDTVTPVVTLGNIYKVANYEEYTLFNSVHLLNVAQLSQIDDRKFSVFSDSAKSQAYAFTYVGLITNTDTVIQSDFHTIIVSITNSTSSTLTDMLYDLTVPNIGTGYTALTDALIVIPVVGVMRDNQLTSNALLWDTQIVRTKIPIILSNDTIYVTFTTGTFSNTNTITGSVTTSFTFVSDIVQLPLIAVQLPLIDRQSVSDVIVFTESALPTPTTDTLIIPASIALALLTVTEITGNTRNDIEITVDVSDIITTFKYSLRVFDGTTRLPVNTVGVNNDNSIATTYNDWDGYRIRFKATLPGGAVSTYVIKVGSFNGTVGEFTQSVQSDIRHNLHFSGNLLDSATGLIGFDGGVLYNSDKNLAYYKALQLTASAYAKLSLTTNVNDYSISFWFATVVEASGILCFSSTSTIPATIRDIEFTITSEGYIQCQVLSGAGAVLIGNNKIYADSQWHHIVLTSSSIDGLKLYADTVLVAVGPIITRTITTTFVYLGWCSSYFEGYLDEFRIYDKALLVSEVHMLNSIFDGTVTDTDQFYQRTASVHSVSSKLTNISDISGLQGAPVLIYKYRDIDETIVRLL